MAGSNRCGFLLCMYYLSCRNTEDFTRHTTDLHRADLTRDNWIKRRRQIRTYLMRNYAFKNAGKNGEAGSFKIFFSLENFKWLLPEQQRKHTLLNCQECQKYDTYFLLKDNKRLAAGPAEPQTAPDRCLASTTNTATQNTMTSATNNPSCTTLKPDRPTFEERFRELLQTTPELATDAASSIGATIEKTFNSVTSQYKHKIKLHDTLKKRKVTTEDRVSHQCRRSILVSSLNSVKDSAIENDFLSLYTSDMSAAGYERARLIAQKDTTGRKPRVKSHTSPLDSYKYDEELLQSELVFIEDLGTLHKQWSELSRKVKLVNKDGNWPKNGGQVIKKIVKSLGYHVPERNKRVRQSNLNFPEYDINVPRRAPKSLLIERKQAMLASGEIDAGEKIVPIEYEVLRVGAGGKLVKTAHEVSGRKFSIKSIQQDHLSRMYELGVLRSVNTKDMTEVEVCCLLSEHGEPSVGVDDRQRLEELSSTRNIVVWHDHSDICGASHYLFMMWFAYDSFVYLTNEEYREKNNLVNATSVQRLVETPYVYMLARSGASVKDQLLYVPTRLEDLHELSGTVKGPDGINYKDRLRFFSGDTPARQLEAGQQRGGSYPCCCGVEDTVFGDSDKFNMRPPYQSLEDRMKVVDATDTWRESAAAGNIAPFTSMKKEDLKDELRKRGKTEVDQNNYTTAELRSMLTKELKGIKRPPALHCTRAEPVNAEQYEICMMEPLHDLKNVISKILNELPNAIKDKDLKEEVEETLLSLGVGKRDQKGTECRLNLIKMANKLSSHQDHPEGLACYKVLLHLVELQKIAYSEEEQRTPKLILRAYNQSFMFALAYMKLFKGVKTSTPLSMFGVPFHNISVHLPETMRLVNGRTIMAEAAERHFNKLKQLSLRATNRHADNIITGCMFRLSLQRKYSRQVTSFDKQNAQVESSLIKSEISQASDHLALGDNTMMPLSMLNDYQTAAIQHLNRIADYIELGEGEWYSVKEDNLVFNDGKQDPDTRKSGPYLTSYRSSSYADIQRKLDRSWTDCLRQSRHLGISIMKVEMSQKDEQVSTQTADKRDDVENMSFPSETPKSMPPRTATAEPRVQTGAARKKTKRGLKSFVCSIPLLTAAAGGEIPSSTQTLQTSNENKDKEKVRSEKSVESIIMNLWPKDDSKLTSYYQLRTQFKETKSSLHHVPLSQASKDLLPQAEPLLQSLKEKEHTGSNNKLKSDLSLAVSGDNPSDGNEMKALKYFIEELKSFIM